MEEIEQWNRRVQREVDQTRHLFFVPKAMSDVTVAWTIVVVVGFIAILSSVHPSVLIVTAVAFALRLIWVIVESFSNSNAREDSVKATQRR